MKIILTVSDDNEYGTAGLTLTGKYNHAPDMGDGYLLAHDIVEHVNGADAIGGLEDELEALGAVWLVRGHQADLRRPNRSIYSPEQTLARDVVGVMRYWQGRQMRFNPRTHAHDMDEDFDYILSTGVADAHVASECDHISAEQRHDFLVAAKHLMRTGARKLARRFKHLDRRYPEYAANTLFYNIVEEVQNRCKYMELGQQFELSIVGTNARITEHYGEYY